MNILQHKSWHVYSQKNRDKVQQDEAQAEAEQAKIDERAVAADREHRLNILRERSRRRLANEITDVDAPERESDEGIVSKLAEAAPVKQDHINFWPELENIDQKNWALKSRDTSTEKKAEERRQQFPANHLDSVIKGPSPWYSKPGAGAMTAPAKKEDHDYSKSRQDPLQTMKIMLEKKESAKRNRSPSPSNRRQSSHNASRKREADDVVAPKEMSKMEILRKERMERELEERRKARALTDPKPATGTGDDRRSAYNQQFNPLATKSAHAFSHKGEGSKNEYNSRATDRFGRGHSGDRNNQYRHKEDRHSYSKDDHRTESCQGRDDRGKDGSHRRDDDYGSGPRYKSPYDDRHSGRGHYDDGKRARGSTSSRDRRDSDSRRR